jgi:pimeloyl-ACP methyl ester carboxylesterase
VLIDQLFAADLTIEVPQVAIPVYFISGRYDYTVNHDLSKMYLDQLQSPVKGFYTFEQSAHSPLFEEPERFVQIMIQDVPNGTTALADVELRGD